MIDTILKYAARQDEFTTEPAKRRARAYTVAAIACALVLFFGLAVKAQVAPAKPHWTDFWPGYETKH